ncbi:hypothetical protein COV20_02545 [Candidatus Woesearchaeota archaeon CG10_big_fil_rev_8_21_14_0_10_45_16]|nr:MAG: hypothetical protein COV20_02545 [Candidatus Woesearchaeota archaeon CG10_big_fil_rev_8_21_14_0_10_45_16]
MRWVKVRWVSWIVLAVLILAVSVAADSTVTLKPIDDQIKPSETATYSLSITNTESLKQRYTTYSLQSGQGWIVDTKPLKDKIIELAGGQSYTTTLQVRPLENMAPGIYYLDLSVESDLGEKHRENIKVYLSPEQPFDYLPSITAKVDMDERIVPGQPLSIKLFLDNKNPLDLKNLVIKLQSDISEFSKEVMVDLPPLQQKTVEFTVMPDQFQQPKDYFLFFVFERNDQVVKIVEKRVEVQEIITPFEKSEETQSDFLRTFVALNIHNGGNVKNTQTVVIPVSLWQSLFSHGDDLLKMKIDSQRYLSWEESLSPDESVVVYYTTSYRSLLYLLIALVIFLSFYFYVQSPITVSKSAVTTKSDEDGALSEIKITIEVRNKTKKPIKNVDITDMVPAIANVKKSLELGTLKPQEVKHSLQGTKVKWSLAEIDGHEHRLITYKVRAKLNIVGMFSLPRAVVEFGEKKRKSKAYSNIFRLHS